MDKPAKNLNLTNPYCNDPDAVNYNWGFPGKPDNTVCFYPADLFTGVDSFFIDSIFQKDLSFTRRDSFMLSILKLTNTNITAKGFCTDSVLHLTADKTYNATIDTVLGGIGPAFCRGRDSVMGDTITGTIARDISLLVYPDTTSGLNPPDTIKYVLLHINFQVASDTGITFHKGTMKIRQH